MEKNIFIIEDEILYLEQLQLIVEKAGHKVCGFAQNAEETLKKFETSEADLALIDINLNGEMSGLEIGRWLKRFKDIPLIYITSYYNQDEYFEGAKKTGAYAFLSKPIEEVHLARTIELALNTIPEPKLSSNSAHNLSAYQEDTLLLRKKTKYIKIFQQDITHIVAQDKYCVIHLKDGTTHQERITLKDLGKKLSPKLFAQIHRSFIVNLQEVEATDLSKWTINIGKHQLPLGDTYKDYFLYRFGVTK